MADAVLSGARSPDLDQEKISIRFLQAKCANADDLRWCNGLILGTPENFGYMSGALKDFFDRTFYSVEGQIQGLPWCLFVKAGNDGSGAVSSIERIVKGYAFRQVCEPVIVKGEVKDTDLQRCKDLGMAFAAGMEAGIY